MKLKNSDIVRIFTEMPEIRKKQLPIKVSFAINKNMAALESTAKSYDAERTKIVNKYCEKDESGQLRTNGNEYVIADKEAYGEEIKELLGIENEIRVHTVTLDELEKCDSGKFDALTPAELSLLEFMISEE